MKLEPFERYYTLRQCRKLRKLLDSESVTDPDFAVMFEDIDEVIKDAEARLAAAKQARKRVQ